MVTRAEMQAALDAAGGNKAEAARALGIPRKTFSDRLERESILHRDQDDLIQQWSVEHGVPLDDISAYWHKSGEYSVLVRPKSSGEPTYLDLRDEIIAEMRTHAPQYDPIEYDPAAENLLVIDPADVHFGKLAEASEAGNDYDLDVAAAYLREGVRGVLAKAQAHGIAKILFVLGNDILHIDTPRRTTTSGTPQDTAGSWHRAYRVAKDSLIGAIEACAAVAPVHLVHCPSNHDFMSGYMLSDSIVSWFAKHPNVEANPRSVDMRHRKYIQFGSNLLGFTHGDGAKDKDLHSLALTEARTAFSECDRVYWHCHHVHHKIRKMNGVEVEKDHIGATVIHAAPVSDVTDKNVIEYIRSASASDGWHHRNGYVGAVQAIEAFVYSPRSQIARFTHQF